MLKLVIGSALVAYVLRSKMVDLNSIPGILFNAKFLLIAMGCLAFSLLCCSLRWLLLVRAQGIRLSFLHLLELYMIGNFFNTFMPGSVGGDLIKAWYIAGREPNRKTKAVFTVLLDRAVGLWVIIFYSAVTILFFPEWLEARAELRWISLFIWSFTGATILGGLLFFISGLYPLQLVERTIQWISKSPFGRLIDSALVYRNHTGAILWSVLISFISILSLNLFYRYFGEQLGIQMTLAQYFFVVPLALTATAVPLLPGGIGVGQVAFYKLFQWVGISNPELGGTLCTLLQVYTLLFNCIGAVFYIRYKRRPVLLDSPLQTSHDKRDQAAAMSILSNKPCDLAPEV